MAPRTLPGFGLQGFAPYGEDGYNTWLDDDLKRLSSTAAQMRVLSRVTSLPGSPSQGDIYIVPEGDDDAGQVAVYDNGAWTLYTPQSGWRTWVIDETGFVFWNGVAWVDEKTDSGGVSAVFDSVAQLQGTTFLTPPESIIVNAPGGPFAYDSVGAEPSHGGKLRSFDGSWFELLTPQVNEALVGSTAAMNTFIAEMLARPPSYARYINPVSGLKISDYATTTGAFVDQLDQLQAAVNNLIAGSVYNVLDLEGRSFAIRDTLVIDDNTGLFNKPKIICNGALSPADGFPQGKPLIEFRRSGGGTLQLWELDHLFFRCSSTASGVLVTPAYNSLRMTHCHVSDPAGNPAGAGDAKLGYGFKSLVAGGNTRIEFCDIRKSSESPILPPSRTMIGIWLAPNTNDGKIIGNRITYARTALRGNVNSFTIIGNHFWQGPEGPGPHPSSHYSETIYLGSRSHNLVIGNYIDNGKIVLEEGLDTGGSDGFIGYGQFIGNIFTVLENDSDYSFLLLRPKGASRGIRDIVFIGNQLRSLGSNNNTVTKPFGVDTTYGTINAAYSVGNAIRDNNFRQKVVPQETEIERYIARPGGGVTAFTVDFTGFTPFGLRCENVKSCGIRYNSDPGTDGSYRYTRDSATSGTLRITPAAAGSAVLTMTCNSGSIYDTPLSGF